MMSKQDSMVSGILIPGFPLIGKEYSSNLEQHVDRLGSCHGSVLSSGD